jgi:hypothetical protein
MAMTPELPPTFSSCCFPGSAAGRTTGRVRSRARGWLAGADSPVFAGGHASARWPPWPRAWIWYPASPANWSPHRSHRMVTCGGYGRQQGTPATSGAGNQAAGVQLAVTRRRPSRCLGAGPARP